MTHYWISVPGGLVAIVALWRLVVRPVAKLLEACRELVGQLRTASTVGQALTEMAGGIVQFVVAVKQDLDGIHTAQADFDSRLSETFKVALDSEVGLTRLANDFKEHDHAAA